MKRLKNEADLLSAIVRWILHIGNRVSPIKQGSLRGPVQRAKHLEQRRFSATTRTGDGNEFALRHAEIYASQRLYLTVIKLFRDPSGLEHVSWRVRGRGFQGGWTKPGAVYGTSRILIFSSLLFRFYPEFLLLFFSARVGFQLFLLFYNALPNEITHSGLIDVVRISLIQKATRSVVCAKRANRK